jgi:hypothetical protein
MAKRFGTYLLEQNILTEKQLAQALERQVTVGGRLGTNVVELGFLTDQQLAQALSRHLHMASAPADAFDDIATDLIRLFPKNLAQRHGAVPFKKEGRSLCIAMADPSELTALDEITFVAGCPVKTYLAPEVKIQSALERYYGVAKPLRYVALWMPKEDRVSDGEGERSEEDQEQTFPSIENFIQGLKTASEELLHAKHRDEIVGILLRECTKVADLVLFFAITEGRAIGLMGRGSRFAPEQFLALELRLDDSPLLRQVADKEEPVMQRVGGEAVGTVLSSLLAGSQGRQFVALPLAAGGFGNPRDTVLGGPSRVIGILCMETRPLHEDFPYIEPLQRLVVKAGMAMDMLILKKKILEL